ncbi:hypothetical protein QEH52_01070 [Coraliomargarita sp. SDUM461003]|uniref:YcaO domain-containing protein n=1 Tax=Thalassobacterium maritimum TaxID=3041265 RepID=A0ABU1API2_9BACT|nr:hypothetical protein [Coraliomargarita sp. SDUM461003]MDQ8206085.1 hypothetical protein [Coraliomargarita sp. SDUM461003]
MLSLAPIRYAQVMRAQGGPIDRLEHTVGQIWGKPRVQAVAYLREELVPIEFSQNRVSEQPDGAGAHETQQVACHMAISEALERWAVYHCRGSEAGDVGGMDLDSSSNGFAAYPGLFKRQARAAAFRESIERHCLISWWEELLGHRSLPDPLAGVTAIKLENPFSRHEVALLWTEVEGRYAYAFGAGSNELNAIQRALVELDRTIQLLRVLSPEKMADHLCTGDVFERRIVFFASEAGRHRFMKRLASMRKVGAPKMNLLFDAAVNGPWDRYVSVWRTVIEAPSREYLSDSEDYFFW